MGNSPTTLQPGLYVHFYGAHSFKTESLFIPPSKFPVTYEQVCIEASKHLCKELAKFYEQNTDKTIGPLFLPIFGLYGADHSQQRWVSQAHIFKDSGNVEEFYFRVKVRMAKNRQPARIVTEYYYLQCADDFWTGRLWTHFDANIKDVSSLHSISVFGILSSAKYPYTISNLSKLLASPLKDVTHLSDIKSRLNPLRMSKFIPKNLPPSLHREFDFIMKCVMYMKLRDGLTECFNNWSEAELREMRQQFVEEIFNCVPEYGLEHYPAKHIEGENSTQDVEIVIQPYQEGCAPGLYFHKMLVCPLTGILGIRIPEQDQRRNVQKCRVQVDKWPGTPLILEFPTREAAESFISVLESYYRLQVKYHDSLNPEQAATPSFQLLQKLHSFGPMSQEKATQRLRQTQDQRVGTQPGEGKYLIFQDSLEFNVFHALGFKETQTFVECYDIHCEYDCKTGDWCKFILHIHEIEKSFSETTHLLEDLRKQLGGQINPRDDECDIMMYFKDDHIMPYYYGDLNPPQNRRHFDVTEHPSLFEDTDFIDNSKTCIAKREFSDVFRIGLKSLNREVIIKRITERRSGYEFQEAFQKGLVHLHGLRQCSSIFIRYYGQLMMPPLQCVLEYVPQGSLRDRLRNSGPRLNWLQIGSVLDQLARCLYDLKAKNMFYGNICSKKILIVKESQDVIQIKLGDVGSAFYLDTLDIKDPLNQKRLPWIAVERFKDLKAHTIESETYSVGTTIWEIIWSGIDPIEKIPSEFTAQTFFERNNFLPVPLTIGDTTDPPVDQPQRQEENSCNATFSEAMTGNAEIQKTTAWVATQNFSAAIPPDDMIATQTGCSAATAATTSSCVSSDTVMTSLSNEQPQNVCSSNSILKYIRGEITSLMLQCWNRNVEARPIPENMIRIIAKVIEQTRNAIQTDPKWQIRLCLDVIRDMGTIADPSAAQKLEEHLAVQSPVDEKGVRESEQLMQELMASCFSKIIPSSLLRFPKEIKCLGRGQFGRVVEGELLIAHKTKEEQELHSKDKGETVAVKELLDKTGSNLKLFYKEVLHCSMLEHPNIVAIKGVVMTERNNPVRLVMEYCNKGTLESHVRNNRSRLGTAVFKQELREIARDITLGMDYLSMKRITHGDLAARNILLTVTGNILVAKVSDFGLSHKLNKSDSGSSYVYKIGQTEVPLPVFWMAFESLHEYTFDTKTDVWSFGTVLWEMFCGGDPCSMGTHNLPKEEIVPDLLKKYRTGQRLPQQNCCPDIVYDVMKKCWHICRENRPTFTELNDLIEQITNDKLE